MASEQQWTRISLWPQLRVSLGSLFARALRSSRLPPPRQAAITDLKGKRSEGKLTQRERRSDRGGGRGGTLQVGHVEEMRESDCVRYRSGESLSCTPAILIFLLPVTRRRGRRARAGRAARMGGAVDGRLLREEEQCPPVAAGESSSSLIGSPLV